MALSDIFAVTYFGNTIQQFLIFFAFISGSILAGKVLYYLSTGIVRKITAKTTTKFDDILIDMLEEPLVFLVFILGFYLGYQHLTLTEGAMLIFEEIAKSHAHAGRFMVHPEIPRFHDSQLSHPARPEDRI
jgi:hypothetical protein